jgi:hypothetical protein
VTRELRQQKADKTHFCPFHKNLSFPPVFTGRTGQQPIRLSVCPEGTCRTLSGLVRFVRPLLEQPEIWIVDRNLFRQRQDGDCPVDLLACCQGGGGVTASRSLTARIRAHYKGSGEGRLHLDRVSRVGAREIPEG